MSMVMKTQRVMSSFEKENVWLFDRGLLYLCRVRDGNRLLEYPVNLITHWLSNASITSTDIDCCSDFLLELVIANALSLDRVKANNNAQQELAPPPYTPSKQRHGWSINQGVEKDGDKSAFPLIQFISYNIIGIVYQMF